MTGIKLWLLLLLLQGHPLVGYRIDHDNEQMLRIFFQDLDLLPPGILSEGVGREDVTRSFITGPRWLENSGHRELFKEIFLELEGEEVTTLRIDDLRFDCVTIFVVPPSDINEENPQMDRYFNDIALRVIRVIEAHFNIECHIGSFELPSNEEFNLGFLPPEPVLPPE